MKLIVYYGSNEIIEEPKHNGGRRFSDFGQGFYTTTNIEMAKSWSSRKSTEKAFVNKFKFDTTNINSLTFDLDINWLLFIAYNRKIIENGELKDILAKAYKDIDKYDVIVGPTADDRMFDTLNMFFENNITLEHCLQALNSMDLDVQYNIRTESGINNLKYISSIELDQIDQDYYAKEMKAKKEIMNYKMEFIKGKYRNVGKYFDELRGSDVDEGFLNSL